MHKLPYMALHTEINYKMVHNIHSIFVTIIIGLVLIDSGTGRKKTKRKHK